MGLAKDPVALDGRPGFFGIFWEGFWGRGGLGGAIPDRVEVVFGCAGWLCTRGYIAGGPSVALRGEVVVGCAGWLCTRGYIAGGPSVGLRGKVVVGCGGWATIGLTHHSLLWPLLAHRPQPTATDGPPELCYLGTYLPNYLSVRYLRLHSGEK